MRKLIVSVAAGLAGIFVALLMVSLFSGPAEAQDAAPSTIEAENATLIEELMAFHASDAIVEVMTTHCYETTGLDPIYHAARENWTLRNIGYLDLADRVISTLGGAQPDQRIAAETYGGGQIMDAFNDAADPASFCQAFVAQVQSGALDIDKQLPGPLARAQAISVQ